MNYPNAHPNVRLNNNFLQEQNKRNFKKVCSSIGFNLVILFLIMSIFIIPFMFFLVYKTDSASEVVYDPISFNLFNSMFSLLAFFIYEIIYVKTHKLSFNKLVPFKKTDLRKFIPLIFITYAAFTVANYATEIISNNFSLLGIHNSEGIDNVGNSIGEYIIYFISIAIVPAISEEFAFRGVILGTMQKYGDGFAIFTSSLLFGLMHGNLEQIPFAFIGGLAMGYVRVYTKSMFPSMVMHSINNSLACFVQIAAMNFDYEIVNLCFTLFLILVISAALISVIYLARKDKKIFAFAADKTTNFTFSEKIKMFFINPGMITALFITALTVTLNMYF